MLPACRKLYPENDFYYVHDGARAHIESSVQALLKEELGGRFVSKDEWPPYSPDINPLDYWFWSAVKTNVYSGKLKPFKDVAELQQKIKRVWRSCWDLQTVRNAIKQFRPRVKAVVEAEGGPIKQLYG